MESNPSAQSASASRPETSQPPRRFDFSQYFLLFALLGILALFVIVIKGFIVPIIVAAVFCTLFHPLYRRMVKLMRGSAGWSAALTCLILLLVLLIPLYLLVNIVINQAVDFYESVGPSLEELFTSGSLAPESITSHPLYRQFKLDQVDWQATIKEGVTLISSYAGKVINATSRGTFAFLSSLIITLFTMFYFFRDGDQIVRKLLSYLPLTDDYKEQITDRFSSISRATIKGTFILGIIQGTLGGLTLWIFGFKAVVMWGMVMVILSLLPMVGAYLVLVPAALYEIAMGHSGAGIAILVISMVVISNVDNLLRPRLVGKDAGMHDLMVFFSTLGGIGFFGIMGFIVGPVVASLLITLLDIYTMEFHRQIQQPLESGDGPGLEVLPVE